MPKQKIPSINNITASLPPSILNQPPKSITQQIPTVPKTEPPFKANPLKTEPYIEESRASKVRIRKIVLFTFIQVYMILLD